MYHVAVAMSKMLLDGGGNKQTMDEHMAGVEMEQTTLTYANETGRTEWGVCEQ